MKNNSWGSLAVLSLLLLEVLAFTGSPASGASGVLCTANTDPFTVTGATWGTAAAPQSAYPGDQNFPLTVSLLFSGPCFSPQTTFQLNLSGVTVFTGPGGTAQPEVIASSTIEPNTQVTETFYLNISPTAPTSATGVNYDLPLSIMYSSNSTSDQITQAVTVPVSLRSPVALSFTSTVSHLVAGENNNVTFTVSNTGTGDASEVALSVAAPTSVTVLNQIPTVQSLDAGTNSSATVDLFVPSSLSGDAVALSFTAKYLDAYENSQTFTQNVEFIVGNAVSTSSSFATVSALWGSGATSPLPGTQDASLVVTLQYLGLAPVTSLQGTVQLPAGVTNLNGQGTATAVSAATTDQYGAVQLTFYVDIGSGVRPGSYNYTLSLTWMTSVSSGMTQTAVLTPPPIAQLQSSFQVEGTTWEKALNSTSSAATSVISPEPGSSDIPLVVSLQYLGSPSVTSIEGTLSLPSGFSDLNGHPTATAFAASASSGQVVSLTFDLDLASTVKPGSYNFTLGLSWTTSNSVPLTQTTVISPAPVVSATTNSFPISITEANSTVTAGSTTAASFVLTNDGSATIFSPTFSITIGSPLVLASIGSTIPASQLNPGANETFTAQVTSGPSASAGIYSGSLEVDFSDSSGTSHSENFPLSFTLEGTVILVIQDETVSQSTTGFTITGSILDEGSASLYYSSISGVLGTASATPVYLGEIDPNTPLPFSITIPFVAPATLATSSTTATASHSGSTTTSTRTFSRSGNFTRIGNFTLPANFSFPAGFGGVGNFTRGATGSSVTIALSLTYMDTFGKSHIKAFTVPATVETQSELSGGDTTPVSTGSSSSSELKDIAYGVVAAVVVVLLVGAFMARRYRVKRLASLPQEQKAEQSVI